MVEPGVAGPDGGPQRVSEALGLAHPDLDRPHLTHQIRGHRLGGAKLEEVHLAPVLVLGPEVDLELEETPGTQRHHRGASTVGKVIGCRPEDPVIAVEGGAGFLGQFEVVVFGTGDLGPTAAAREAPEDIRVVVPATAGLDENLALGLPCPEPTQIAPGHGPLKVDNIGYVRGLFDKPPGIDLYFIDFPILVVLTDLHLHKVRFFARGDGNVQKLLPVVPYVDNPGREWRHVAIAKRLT